ncbi:hypothetical protein LTR17_015746 [Elasticomyces elasticus]|nr:hypothetical protein LTR17_015746 [Elasticomyces elasticus]
MSIFKGKLKTNRGHAEKDKKKSKEDAKKQALPDKPAQQQPYKPTHAASDAVPKLVTVNGRNYSQIAADYAQGSATLSLAPNGNQPCTHSGIRPVVTDVNPTSLNRSFPGGFNVMQRNKIAGVFTTALEAPPMPTSSTLERR